MRDVTVPLLIGLIGDQPGVGKDTVAAYLVAHHAFRRVTFADALYEEAAEAFGVSVEELGRRDLKEVPQARFALENCRDSAFVPVMLAFQGGDLRTPRSPRELLRCWGTEYRRSQDENYWFGPKRDLIEQQPANSVLTDPRLENELIWASHRGVMVRIERPALMKPEPVKVLHNSERLAQIWPTNFVLINRENDLPGLYNQVDEMMANIVRCPVQLAS